MSTAAVQLQAQQDRVVVDNGVFKLTLTNPGGRIVGIQYNGLENLLELNNPSLNGGLWDLNFSEAGAAGTRGKFETIEGTDFKVIFEDEKRVELSFKRTWNSSLQGEHAPLTIDKRFIVLRGSSGFYSYAIYERDLNMPAFNLNETRIAFMLKIDKFRYMAVADDRQRFMPFPDDRLSPRGKELAFPEAVLLVDPIEPEFKGEVDDKYEYSTENEDNKVHGFICLDPPIGFWQITPSNEFRTGAPTKQDLTSHVNPTTLAMFVSTHYGGEDLVVKFSEGEAWKKVFGPVFIYLNSTPPGDDIASSLWEDAKKQMEKEVKSWPYSFPASEDFTKADQRGGIRGRLLVQDRHVSKDLISANGAYVGLAPPGDAGSFQRENKGYQFWKNADSEGYFRVDNIRPGDYNLYAWVPGFIGDYRFKDPISITPGSQIDLGDLVYEPPRDGPTLWEIGIPDRTASEFYIPDPNPLYINKLYIDKPAHRFRQYGLWERYAELYPDGDLVYEVGVSDYTKDWFYAQVPRKVVEGKNQAITWQIKFKLDRIDQAGTYKLRIALASANRSDLQIRINDPEASEPLFSSGVIGSDNAIARHGIHGLYWLFNVDIDGSQLQQGENSVYLKSSNKGSLQGYVQGFMYDYIRMEAPTSGGPSGV